MDTLDIIDNVFLLHILCFVDHHLASSHYFVFAFTLSRRNCEILFETLRTLIIMMSSSLCFPSHCLFALFDIGFVLYKRYWWRMGRLELFLLDKENQFVPFKYYLEKFNLFLDSKLDWNPLFLFFNIKNFFISNYFILLY